MEEHHHDGGHPRGNGGAGIPNTGRGRQAVAEARFTVFQTPPEDAQETLQDLEGVVFRGREALLEAGRALRKIKKRQLFVPSGKDWDSYCFDTFGWHGGYADRLIRWAKLDEAFDPIGLKPENELQARELYPLMGDPGAAKEVWERVGEESGGAHPAGAIRDALRERGYVKVPEDMPPEDAEVVLGGFDVARTGPHRESADPKTYAGGGNYRVRRKQQKLEEERRLANTEPTAETGTGDVHIHNTPFQALGGLVPDDGVDLILTDPPYHGDDGTLSLWDDLGEFAARTLKPDGLLVSYTGNFHLDEVLKRMGRSVPYWWLMVVTHTGKEAAYGKGMSADFKPMPVFRRRDGDPYEGRLKGKMRPSTIEGRGGDKEHHPWGQPLEEALHLIESFTRPGELVCDPFSGGGTVAVAAKMLGRSCVAAEKDPAWHARSIERLAATPDHVPKKVAQKVQGGVDPARVRAVFGGHAGAGEPAARSAATQEARVEGIRDALEGVGVGVLVLRPRDFAEAGRKLRRYRFTR